MVEIQPGTVPQTAPSAQRYIMPNQMQVERVGNMTSGITETFPEVRGGICEYCGVIDGNHPSHMQYRLCPHYRGMDLRCTYCPASKDSEEITNHSVLRILKHPEKSNTLLIHCNSFECLEKHKKRWQVANA